MTIIVNSLVVFEKMMSAPQLVPQFKNVNMEKQPKFEVNAIESGRKYMLKTTLECNQLTRINRLWLAFSIVLQALIIVPVILNPEKFKRLCNKAWTGVETVSVLVDKVALVPIFNTFLPPGIAVDRALSLIDNLPYAQISEQEVKNGSFLTGIASSIR
jgi:hypothetical protein